MENELREPAVAYGKSKFTIEEYLQMEETSEEKHEYYEGKIFDRPNVKVSHNIVCGNLFYGLRRVKKKIIGYLIVISGYTFLKILCLLILIFL